MNTTKFKGNEVHLSGNVPNAGSKAPDFTYVKEDLSEGTLHGLGNQKKVIIAVPSLDTGVCQMETKHFNKELSKRKDVVGLVVSKDLPFAQSQFCGAEGIKNVEMLSDFRTSFGQDYGVELKDGPLRNLLSRAVVVINPEGEVVYKEQVPEIGQEPDYEAALKAV